MALRFRNNCKTLDFAEDYHKIRTFLLKLKHPNYLFGRWDWMITHGYLDKSGLPNIGVWEDGGDIVAMATYDCSLGKAYFCVDPPYDHLKKEMLLYAQDALSKDGAFEALISDRDMDFQGTAAALGYIATDAKENDAVYPIHLQSIRYTLPNGFRVTSMAEEYDLYKYAEVLWKGFNHEVNGEGEFKFPQENIHEWEHSMKRPNVHLDLKIAVVAPNGSFVSYCGMWYDPNSDYALVEPVATDPAYRKLGLGKAAVLEGIKRCGQLGAKMAFVGSSQQFYYSIGFRPYETSTWWKMR